jgi:hypothetical protein
MTKQLLFIIIAVIIITTACTNQPSLNETNFTTGELEILTEETAPPIDICQSLDVPNIAFPRQEYVEGPKTMIRPNWWEN